MNEILKSFFEKENIEFYASAQICPEFVSNPKRLPEWARYVTVFLIPYNTGVGEKRNVSRYAVSRDYHLYVKQLEKRLEAECKENFRIFADTSPFDERTLAKKLSLGVFGKNGLLINEKYGSFVFLGEIVTQSAVSLRGGSLCEREACLSCGGCAKVCPTGALTTGTACVSEITQKKKISCDEEEIIKKHSLVWGCDICQDVCPHNKNVPMTPIRFFYDARLEVLTSDSIERMSDEEFLSRAYSWRGKNVILRNLTLKL